MGTDAPFPPPILTFPHEGGNGVNAWRDGFRNTSSVRCEFVIPRVPQSERLV